MKYMTSLVGVVCIVAAAGAGLAAAQSAGSVLPIFVDYGAPPERLHQLTAMADAVVAVRVEAIRFESPVDPRVGRAHDVTKYNVRILDTLKAHAMLPPMQSTLTITRLGGQHIESGRVVASAVRGFDDFQQNGEYVLFLTWNKHTNDFDIAYGPSGSYQLLPSGTVRPLGKSNVATTQSGRDMLTFIQELRIASAR